MKAQTKKALDDTIIQWGAIVAFISRGIENDWGVDVVDDKIKYRLFPDTSIPFGSDACPLCARYVKPECVGCPLAEVEENCDACLSLFWEFCHADGEKAILKSAKNMLRVLKALRWGIP